MAARHSTKPHRQKETHTDDTATTLCPNKKKGKRHSHEALSAHKRARMTSHEVSHKTLVIIKRKTYTQKKQEL